ncbi:hypothetical protein KCP74_09825 [Salmonella enterica subsp. enterica]|nr:hypothetical protein KCP74_09825 [Salmonella enterica subsp. enterica]
MDCAAHRRASHISTLEYLDNAAYQYDKGQQSAGLDKYAGVSLTGKQRQARRLFQTGSTRSCAFTVFPMKFRDRSGPCRVSL